MKTISRNNETNKAMNALYLSNAGSVKIMTVAVNKICMDKYQRPCSPNRVKKIVEEFNEFRMEPVKLSHRNGMFYCVDGQHRVSAFKAMGRDTIQAQVMTGLTYEQEAFLFAEQQRNVVPVAKRHEWSARVAAGTQDKETQDIIGVVESFGYKIDANANGGSLARMDKNNKRILAVRELQSIYHNGGTKWLNIVFTIIDSAWNGAPNSTNSHIVGAIHRIMQTHNLGEYEMKRLIKNLKLVSPNELLAEAQTLGGKSARNVALVICKLYNARLAQDNKHRLEQYKI